MAVSTYFKSFEVSLSPLGALAALLLAHDAFDALPELVRRPGPLVLRGRLRAVGRGATGHLGAAQGPRGLGRPSCGEPLRRVFGALEGLRRAEDAAAKAAHGGPPAAASGGSP